MKGLAKLTRSRLKDDTLARAVLDFRSITGTKRYRKFIIVGTARTGSTLLVDLLRNHGQARVFGELFRAPDAIGWDVKPFATFQHPGIVSLYQSDPIAFLETHVFRRWPGDCKAVGFKLFYYHARTQPHLRVWDYLAASPDITIIHLRRRNLLAQYYSLRLAHTTNMWTRSQEAIHKPEPIRLELNECLAHFTQLRALENQCARFFAAHSVHDLWYEDMVAERVLTMARMQDLLGLTHDTPITVVSRQRTSSLREVIANHDELSQGFAGTPWAAFTGDGADIAGG